MDKPIPLSPLYKAGVVVPAKLYFSPSSNITLYNNVLRFISQSTSKIMTMNVKYYYYYRHPLNFELPVHTSSDVPTNTSFSAIRTSVFFIIRDTT